MKEHDVESYLKRQVKARNGLCWKWVSPGLRGVPDQIVMFPGVICFVELKAPGELPRPQQVLRHNDLTSMGFQVEVVDDYRGVDKLVNALCLESLG